MSRADEEAAKPDAAGSGEQSDQQLRAILDNLQRVSHQGNPGRGSRGFFRYLVAILIGVAATLAWQSYGDATKQIIATKAPELGWSPEAKQMIASWTLGWTKPSAPVAQTAPENVAPKAPATVSLNPDQLQQITGSLTTLRETVEQLTAGQDQMTRVIDRLESAVTELIVKMPEPPPQPPAAPARKPTPTAPPPSSRAPIAPRPPPRP